MAACIHEWGLVVSLPAVTTVCFSCAQQALNSAKAEAARLQAQDQSKLKELMDQKKELEKQLAVVSGHCEHHHGQREDGAEEEVKREP